MEKEFVVKIGADPELFLAHNGEVVSAYNTIPGTKQKPFAVPFGAVQVDGMALEINIDPATSPHDFLLHINTVLEKLSKMIPANHDMLLNATATFTEEYLAKQPEEALDLGCDPDFNAYTGAMNPIPRADSLMRTAAGHIHIGWTEDKDPMEEAHFQSCCQLVRQFDFFLGLPSLGYDTDYKRRELYGKAGSFRPKPYGLEYRVLSNFWLKADNFIKGVFDRTWAAWYNLAIDRQDYFTIYPEHSVKNIIDEGDYRLADYLIKKLHLQWPIRN